MCSLVLMFLIDSDYRYEFLNEFVVRCVIFSGCVVFNFYPDIVLHWGGGTYLLPECIIKS